MMVGKLGSDCMVGKQSTDGKLGNDGISKGGNDGR